MSRARQFWYPLVSVAGCFWYSIIASLLFSLLLCANGVFCPIVPTAPFFSLEGASQLTLKPGTYCKGTWVLPRAVSVTWFGWFALSVSSACIHTQLIWSSLCYCRVVLVFIFSVCRDDVLFAVLSSIFCRIGYCLLWSGRDEFLYTSVMMCDFQQKGQE